MTVGAFECQSFFINIKTLFDKLVSHMLNPILSRTNKALGRRSGPKNGVMLKFWLIFVGFTPHGSSENHALSLVSLILNWLMMKKVKEGLCLRG